MKKYLRFGEIPKNGKSVNFLKMSFSQGEDFTFFCENGDMEQAYERVPEDAYEAGVSVFKMNENRLPVLNNLQLINSLLGRINEPVYEILGKEIATGQDGEPVVTDFEIIKKRRIKKECLLDYVLEILLKNFKSAHYDKSAATQDEKVFHFYAEYKVNKVTGEKISKWEKTSGDEWVNVPPVDEYVFRGWTFSNPVEGFNVRLR